MSATMAKIKKAKTKKAKNNKAQAEKRTLVVREELTAAERWLGVEAAEDTVRQFFQTVLDVAGKDRLTKWLKEEKEEKLEGPAQPEESVQNQSSSFNDWQIQVLKKLAAKYPDWVSKRLYFNLDSVRTLWLKELLDAELVICRRDEVQAHMRGAAWKNNTKAFNELGIPSFDPWKSQDQSLRTSKDDMGLETDFASVNLSPFQYYALTRIKDNALKEQGTAFTDLTSILTKEEQKNRYKFVAAFNQLISPHGFILSCDDHKFWPTDAWKLSGYEFKDDAAAVWLSKSRSGQVIDATTVTTNDSTNVEEDAAAYTDFQRQALKIIKSYNGNWISLEKIFDLQEAHKPWLSYRSMEKELQVLVNAKLIHTIADVKGGLPEYAWAEAKVQAQAPTLGPTLVQDYVIKELLNGNRNLNGLWSALLEDMPFEGITSQKFDEELKELVDKNIIIRYGASNKICQLNYDHPFIIKFKANVSGTASEVSPSGTTEEPEKQGFKGKTFKAKLPKTLPVEDDETEAPVDSPLGKPADLAKSEKKNRLGLLNGEGAERLRGLHEGLFLSGIQTEDQFISRVQLLSDRNLLTKVYIKNYVSPLCLFQWHIQERTKRIGMLIPVSAMEDIKLQAVFIANVKVWEREKE